MPREHDLKKLFVTNLPCFVIVVIQRTLIFAAEFVEEELSELDEDTLSEHFDLMENRLL